MGSHLQYHQVAVDCVSYQVGQVLVGFGALINRIGECYYYYAYSLVQESHFECLLFMEGHPKRLDVIQPTRCYQLQVSFDRLDDSVASEIRLDAPESIVSLHVHSHIECLCPLFKVSYVQT